MLDWLPRISLPSKDSDRGLPAIEFAIDRLFVVSGPSGVGKTTLFDGLRDKTRPPEVAGHAHTGVLA